MQFLAPLMLIGLVGGALPVIIHLIGRRRAPLKKFGAIDFLLGTNRRVARQLRLRELMLLVLRVAACLAIPLAIAKPFVSCASRGPAIVRGPQAVVLIVDNSFAMGFRRGDGTLFQRAKERARRVLDELGNEASVAVVYTAEGAPAPLELSRDHIKLSDEIVDAPLSARPADTSLALRRAGALLLASPHQARRIYLFSPLAQTGFPPGDPPWPAGAGIELHVDDVTDGATLPNAAITAAHAEPDAELGNRGVRVIAEIANFGATPVKDRAVTLRIGGRAVARGLVSLAPGETQSKRFSAALPSGGDGRGAEVVVELDDDGLPLDDRRYLRAELEREVHVLIVDGDPRTVRRDDETFYLEMALRPGDRADSALAVTTTTVDELARRRLADYDAIFLCNVKPLDPGRVAELEAWVKKGGGLFVALGDNVDAEAYNAAMAPILPAELRAAKELAPRGGGGGPGSGGAAGSGGGGGSVGASARDGLAEHIEQVETGHPIFAQFTVDAPGLKTARFWKIFLVGPGAAAHGDARRTIARYGSGAPALIEARLGQGRVLLLTSTLDRDWNDLAIRAGFLPFVQETARYLARSPTREGGVALDVGRTWTLPVAPEDARLEVTAPDFKKTVFDAEKLKGRTSVAFSDTNVPGVYRVASVGADGTTRARPGADFVVNLDPRGSDTRKIAPADLPGAGEKTTIGAAAARAPRRRVELWHGVAAALLAFLFAEALVTRRG